MKHILAVFLLFAAAGPGLAQTKSLQNLDPAGVALQGYDPVAFFTETKPVKGSAAFPARQHGATYLFATKENRELFKANPAKYEPAFGGYCAYGVSRGKLVEIDVEAFQLVEGRLLLQYSKGVRDDFNQDAKANLAKAEANWPVLLEKKGK